MRIRLNWKQIEKYFIYVGLVLGIVSEIIEASWPSIKLLPGIFLGFALLGAFHYLIRAVEEGGAGGHGVLQMRFADAFQEWLRPYEIVKDMRIVAYTSTVYHQFVRTNTVKIKKLRVLLMVEDEPQATCADPSFDLSVTVAKWKALQTAGQIGTLEIRRISRHTPMFFSIAESDRVLVGLLWPNPDLKDIRTMDAALFNRHQMQKLVIELANWFDEMWRLATAVPIDSTAQAPKLPAQAAVT